MKNVIINIIDDSKSQLHFKGEKFSEEIAPLTKVQIDLAFHHGYSSEDIILGFNYPFEYKGVKSLVLNQKFIKNGYDNKLFAARQIIEMFPNERFFLHDMDAFQICETSQLVKFIDWNKYNLPIYCTRKRQFNNGVMFFDCKLGKYCIDKMIHLLDGGFAKNEEDASTKLWLDHNSNYFCLDDVMTKINVLDISYNLGIHDTEYKFAIANKPVKISHFHPIARGRWIFDMFANKGCLKINHSIIPDYLCNLILKHFDGIL